MDRTLLERKSVAELREIATALGLRGYQRLKKAELVDRIISSAQELSPEQPTLDTAASGGADAEDTAAPQAGVPAGDPEPEGDQPGDRGGDQPRDRDRPGETRGDARPSRPERPDRPDRPERPERPERPGRDRKRGRPRGEEGNDGGSGASNAPGGTASPSEQGDVEVREGVLDLLPEGYGFLRCTGYLAGPQDVYVSQSFVRRFDLRRGDLISGPIRRNRNSDKFPALARVDRVEGERFEPRSEDPRRPEFAELTAVSPEQRIVLEHEGGPVSVRAVDLIAPIGLGQRALIVAPPRSGKTTVLKEVATAIEADGTDLHLMALLIDARPEEVTDLERSCDGEVVATTFDRPAEDHTQVAELVVERAKRLVERGQNVVVLLDSLTRLVRAYNVVVPSSGRVLPGGVDPAALYPAKRLFAAARNIDGPGSLTIVATALSGDASRMDEVIVEGLADTANMELHLDAGLAQQRILPAIDVPASGTRREELLLDEAELAAVARLRRDLAGRTPEDGVGRLLARLETDGTNAAFVAGLDEDGLG